MYISFLFSSGCIHLSGIILVAECLAVGGVKRSQAGLDQDRGFVTAYIEYLDIYIMYLIAIPNT